LEGLSDASFLGKLLVLPTNVRLDRKVIARYKHSSLFGLFIGDEVKTFYNIDTRLTKTNVWVRKSFRRNWTSRPGSSTSGETS
jgi:hypothetical protein